jgi:hypothetical protein
MQQNTNAALQSKRNHNNYNQRRQRATNRASQQIQQQCTTNSAPTADNRSAIATTTTNADSGRAIALHNNYNYSIERILSRLRPTNRAARCTAITDDGA